MNGESTFFLVSVLVAKNWYQVTNTRGVVPSKKYRSALDVSDRMLFGLIQVTSTSEGMSSVSKSPSLDETTLIKTSLLQVRRCRLYNTTLRAGRNLSLACDFFCTR